MQRTCMNETLYRWTFSFHKATEFRCGGRFYFTAFRSLSTNPKVKELLKSVHVCQSYRKNKSGTFLWPTVYISSSCNFLHCIGPQNYESWLTVEKVIATISRFTFLAHPLVSVCQCSCVKQPLCSEPASLEVNQWHNYARLPAAWESFRRP